MGDRPDDIFQGFRASFKALMAFLPKLAVSSVTVDRRLTSCRWTASEEHKRLLRSWPVLPRLSSRPRFQ